MRYIKIIINLIVHACDISKYIEGSIEVGVKGTVVIERDVI